MKRVLSLALVLILSLGLFVACSGDDKGDASGNGSIVNGDTAQLEFSKDTVKFIDENSKAVYNIVRPADDQEMFDISSNLFKQMREKLSISMKNTDDSSDGADAYEIVLGNTNRVESQFAADYIKSNIGGRYDDYIICTIGKKIVINGTNATAVSNAIDYFLNNIVSSTPIEGGIMYTHATEGDFKDITINGTDISKFSIVRPHFNTSYLTQLEMEKLHEQIKQTTGFEVHIVEDTETSEGEYEIVVGDANRQGVTKHDKNDTDAFSVRISGNKVYLNGGSTYATAIAVTEFAAMLNDLKAEDSESVEAGSYSTAVAGYDLSKYYTPAWLEDFKAAELDTTKWMHIGWNAEGQNGKKSYRSTETYSFDGEYFTITPYQTDVSYHGGMLRTNRDMSYLYGYVEESAKLPTAKGFWTALWTGDMAGLDETMSEGLLLGNEIDINENFGANYVAANCHSWPTELGEQAGYQHTSCDGERGGNDKKYYPDDGVDLHDDFHTYGMMWTPEYMAFTCDGKVFFTYDTTATEQDKLTFNQHMYLTLSMAVGLKSGSTSISLATEDDWANRSTLVVDYVHLYQLRDGVHEIDLRENNAN